LFFDGVDRGRGRDIASNVTAHAVGNDEERFVHQEGILVDLAPSPDVGFGSDPIVHFFAFRLAALTPPLRRG
jgi:hypothetical protein